MLIFYLNNMKLYHVTKKSNLESIKKEGLSLRYFLTQSKYEEQTSGPAIYLSKFIQGNNLPCSLFEYELISLQIDLKNLEISKIRPDDAIFFAFAQEHMFHEDDLEEIQKAFHLANEEEARLKLDYLDSLTDTQLVEEFKNLGLYYLEEEGEIAYLDNIPFESIEEVIDI